MKTLVALTVLTLTSVIFAGDICTPPPVWEPLVPKCEYPRKITVNYSVMSCYDTMLGIPVWSASALDPKSSHTFDRETCVWHRDKNVITLHPNSYSGTGYVKGHLIAFADSSCEEGAASTCVTSNIIPQPAAQNSGVWAQLEKHIREIASRGKSKKWLVLAGPVLGLPVTWLKPGLVKPEGIWKVLINLTDGTGCGYAGSFRKPYTIQYVPLATLGINGIKEGNREICAGER